MNLIRCYHSLPEWTRERWQWRGTPHSLKLQHYWNLTIRLFTGHSLRWWWWWGLTPLQRSSWCILQPQPTGPQDTRWGKSYPSAEKQSVYYTAPADWATGHLLVEGVLPLSREAVGVFYSPKRHKDISHKKCRLSRYSLMKRKYLWCQILKVTYMLVIDK